MKIKVAEQGEFMTQQGVVCGLNWSLEYSCISADITVYSSQSYEMANIVLLEVYGGIVARGSRCFPC